MREIAGAAAVLALLAGVAAAQDLGPGTETKIDLPDTGPGWYKVYVPANYTRDRKWPVIFFYHGMGGAPEVHGMKQATRGKDFIIVGMGYRQAGAAIVGSPEANRTTWESWEAAEKDVAGRLSVDKTTYICSGFSKGGWHTASMIEKKGLDKFAGAAIIGAGGIYARVNMRLGPPEAIRGMPIYLGAGETCGNRPATEATAPVYRKDGAIVTKEIYAGMGHVMHPDAKDLREWLNFFGTTRYDEKAISDWLDRQVQQAKSAGDIRDAFAMLLAVQGELYWRYLGEESRAKYEAALKETEEDPVVKKEKKALAYLEKVRDLERKAAGEESNQRRQKAYINVVRNYQSFISRYKGTRAAEQAQKSVDEIKKLLSGR